MNETPTISNMAYGSVTSTGDFDWQTCDKISYADLLQQIWPNQFSNQLQPEPETKTYMPEPTRRIVQVFIADPNPNVPLDESVLFKGEQKLTDLTDTELFFEVPIAERMAAHNAKRIKWLDKESTKRAGKDVTLDPVKIRELKMVVVTIAQF